MKKSGLDVTVTVKSGRGHFRGKGPRPARPVSVVQLDFPSDQLRTVTQPLPGADSLVAHFRSEKLYGIVWAWEGQDAERHL